MRWFLIVLAVLTTFPMGGFAAGALSGFIGVWVGEGTVRPGGFGAPQKLRCKVNGTRMSPLQISFAGRCATTSGAGAFSLLIAKDKSGQNFAAKVLLAWSDMEVDFVGVLAGQTITLTKRDPIRSRGKLLSSEITLTLERDGVIGFVNMVTDIDKTTRARWLDVLFRRRL